MEVKRYTVPSAAYPRYDYSVREGISIYNRYNVILKDIGFGDKCETIILSEIGEPQIFVACENNTIQTVGRGDIELNKLNAVQESEKKTYSDLEALMDENEIDNKSNKIVVLELNPKTSMKNLDKWKHNVIIVNDQDEFSPSTIDEVRTTSKEHLGTEICLMLERIAFRNMLPLIDSLRDILDTADFKNLTKNVGMRISDVMWTMLKNEKSFAGWMHDIDDRKKLKDTFGEIIPRNFEHYLLRDINNPDRVVFKEDINTGYIVKFEKGKHGKRKADEETDETDDHVATPTTSTDENELTKIIDENEIETPTASTNENFEGKENSDKDHLKLQVVEYFEKNDIMYELVGKLADHIGRIIEQQVITEYKKLPKELKHLVNVKIENENIRDVVANELFKLFVCTIDSELDDDDPADEMVLVKLRYRTGIITRGLRFIVSQLKILETIDNHIKLIKAESDRAINRLLGDLIGLFRRSKIPEYERPKSGNFKRLNDKVAQKLLENVKEAKGCGYRYDKLHIFIEEIIDQDQKENVETAIKDILVSNNISEYIVSSTTTPVQHYKQVGAKIRAARSGTLGGFALMGEQEHLCALLSKHVVNGALELHYKANADDEIVIGSMINAGVCQDQHVIHASPTNEILVGSKVQSDVGQKQNGNKASSNAEPGVGDIIHSDVDEDNHKVVAYACKLEDNATYDNVIVDFVDVAAAKIYDSVKSTCDTHFKDSKRKSMKSKLCLFTDNEIKELQGLKVHIYGASTELGTGTISIPEFHVKGNQKLVVIEDIEDVDGKIVRFSREGDSGAIICADHPDGDYVQVISMLVGCRNFEKISESDPNHKKNKGEYLSFRMTNGLEALKLETKQEFKLCNAC